MSKKVNVHIEMSMPAYITLNKEMDEDDYAELKALDANSLGEEIMSRWLDEIENRVNLDIDTCDYDIFEFSLNE